MATITAEGHQRLSNDYGTRPHHRRSRRLLQRSSLIVHDRSGIYTRSQGNRLCKRCQEIDLDAIFSKKHLTRDGSLVRTIEPFNQWTIDSCPLCRLLARTFGLGKSEVTHVQVFSMGMWCAVSLNFPQLRSFSSNRSPDMGWKSVDMNMLSLGSRFSSKFLVSQPRGVDTIRILGPLISFGVVREWLNFCQENHSKACGLPENSTLVSSISSFKLIDCETRSIVPVSDQPYTTLSYVVSNFYDSFIPFVASFNP